MPNIDFEIFKKFQNKNLQQIKQKQNNSKFTTTKQTFQILQLFQKSYLFEDSESFEMLLFFLRARTTLVALPEYNGIEHRSHVQGVPRRDYQRRSGQALLGDGWSPPCAARFNPDNQFRSDSCLEVPPRSRAGDAQLLAEVPRHQEDAAGEQEAAVHVQGQAPDYLREVSRDSNASVERRT